MNDLSDKVFKAKKIYNQLALETLQRLERLKQGNRQLAQAATTTKKVKKKKG